MIYYFTGQPASGKTTLAKMLMSQLHRHNPMLIDGDDIREIFQNKDYSEEGRRRNMQLAQNIAYFLHKQDQTVIIALVAPYKDLRDDLKKLVGSDDITEIYVHTTLDRGRNAFHVKEYQQPTEDFVEIDTTIDSTYKSLEKLMKQLNLI